MSKILKELFSRFFSDSKKNEQSISETPLQPVPMVDGVEENALQLPQEEKPLIDSVISDSISLQDTLPEEDKSSSVVFTDVSPLNDHGPRVDTDNRPFTTSLTQEYKEEKTVDVEKLISLLVDTIRYYDKLRNQLPTNDQRTLVDDICDSLIDNLIMSGCTPIDEESGAFSISRHRVSTSQLVVEGTPYKRLLRKGIMFNGEVKLLAIVEL